MRWRETGRLRKGDLTAVIMRATWRYSHYTVMWQSVWRSRISVVHHFKQEKRDRQAVGGDGDLLWFVMESPGDVIFLNDITVCSRSTGTLQQTA